MPKTIFEKNVTRLAKFARVIRETRAKFASSHCLKKTLLSKNLTILDFQIILFQMKTEQLFQVFYCFVFFVELWSWSASCWSLIMKLLPDLYMPTVLKVHPSICGITAYVTMQGRLELSIIYFCSRHFDPNEWCMKNGLLSVGLNPRPLHHKSSALTTWLRLLANTFVGLTRQLTLKVNI